ncbi:MAG: amino acid permease [Candidatus Marinimicrobia bacterium]|nr:amino acid permease [Candidatus Neomarinimicrobiota bacterium]
MTSRTDRGLPSKKSHKLFTFIAFGLGPMLSSGVFLLPGMVYGKIGPAGILAYIAAALLILPSLMSKAELASAMPRAGGTYYFLDRSMGPLIGSISGFGIWLSLVFKTGFELMGLGAYLVLFFDLPVKPVAIALIVVFGVLNITGVRGAATVQATLVSLVLGVLTFFIITGFFHVETGSYTPFFMEGNESFLAAVGFVFVGFAGLTRVSGGAGDVHDLERNNSLGMVSALLISLFIYVLVMLVVIGTVPSDSLSATLTPLSDSASQFLGNGGMILLSAVAVISLVGSVHFGIGAATKYPFAMSRDKMVSPVFKQSGKFRTPTHSIILTLGLILLPIIFLSPEAIARIASAFMLMIFGFINLAVVAMRESKIDSYDPSFKSILYPWPQVIGILAPIVLIPFLGPVPMLFSGGIIIFGTLWYFFYVQKHVKRTGALMRVFQRLGEAASPMLDQELRQILREKGLRKEDAFEESILSADIIQHTRGESFNTLLQKSADAIARQLQVDSDKVFRELSKSNQIGDTPMGDHIALPHARIEGIDRHGLVIVHSSEDIKLEESAEPVYALFILISPMDDPGQHLRFLAELANRSEGIDFHDEWRKLSDDDAIRNLFVRSGEVSEIPVMGTSLTGKRIQDMQMHSSCLVALIRREGQTIIPHGDTVLQENDILTIVGEEAAIDELTKKYQ